MTVKSSSNNQDSLLAKAGIAGFVCAIVAGALNGFDVTKIRLQNQTASHSQQQYVGMISGMMKIYREEGIIGLAKGVEASMLREVSYSSIRIGGYEPIRHILSFNTAQDPANASPVVKFLSAIISGGIGSALANPLDLIKTRFQATLPNDPPPYRHTFHAIRTIFALQGFTGLYKGWMVTCSRAAVLNSAQLGSYDSIKHNLLMNHFNLKDGVALHFISAMSAGIITTTAANPFDVIKTRYLSDSTGQYTSILDCFQKTCRQDGLKGFLKGWTPAYWRLGPHTVLAFLLIEEIRTLLGMNTI